MLRIHLGVRGTAECRRELGIVGEGAQDAEPAHKIFNILKNILIASAAPLGRVLVIENLVGRVLVCVARAPRQRVT